ncbi:hypothetical protein PG993_000539 [Apiospora rasikravindrae]|uniref:Uncharacterized protein n=1 Tax=Apiospora rasikravindrae TaxID=990691 RepID=A0ABR1U9D0_9PEZI
MRSRSPASLRRLRGLKGKAVAHYEPMLPKNNGYNNQTNNNDNSKPQGKRKRQEIYRLPAVPAKAGTCDHCGTLAGPSEPLMTPLAEMTSHSEIASSSDMTSLYSMTPLSERSVWYLEEVDMDELNNAVWVLYEELKLKDTVPPGHRQAQVREAAAADPEVARVLAGGALLPREARVRKQGERARAPARPRDPGVREKDVSEEL